MTSAYERGWIGILLPLFFLMSIHAQPKETTVETVRKYNDTVGDLHFQGRYAEAITLAKKALELAQSRLGSRHVETLRSMNNLSMLYNAQGSYDKAESLLNEILQIMQQTLGKTHPDTLFFLDTLAMLYQVQGMYDRAELLFKEVLQIREQTMGKLHPDTSTSLHNLAALYLALGMYDKAELLCHKALHLRQQILGKTHADTLASLNSLASIYQAQGSYEKAGPLFKEALHLRQQTLGKTHADTLASLNSLASIYQAQGRYDKADPLLKEELHISQQIQGKSLPDTLASMNNLATLYQKQGMYDSAELLCKEAVHIGQQILGKTHPATLASMNELAMMYHAQGMYNKAVPLLKEVLQLRQQILGKTHPHTLASMNNLAGMYQTQNRYDKAEALFKEALDISQQTLGKNHPTTSILLNNLAMHYKEHGMEDKAEPLLKEALHLMQQTLGKNHPHTIILLKNLAELYTTQGKYSLAREKYQQLFSHRHTYFADILPGCGEKQRMYFLSQGKDQDNFFFSLNLQICDQKAAREVFELSLNRKGLLLTISSQIHQSVVKSEDPKVREVFASLMKNRKEIANLILSPPFKLDQLRLVQRIKFLDDEIRSQEAELGHWSERFRAQMQKISPEDVQKCLSQYQVLVDFVVFDRRDFEQKKWQRKYLVATITDSREIRMVCLGQMDKIEEQLLEYRKNVQDISGQSQKHDLGKKLYDAIFMPLLPYVEGKDCIYLVPDGHLHFLPFAALCDEKGRYLVETTHIEILSSARSLTVSLPSTKKRDAIIFAHPDYQSATTDIPSEQSADISTPSFLDKISFSPLPGTQKEAERVSNLMQKCGFLYIVYTGKEASKEKMLAVQCPKILHIATHGFFLENPITGRESERGLGGMIQDTPLLKLHLSQSKNFTSDLEPVLAEKDISGIFNPLTLCGLAFCGANSQRKLDGILLGGEVFGIDLWGTDLVVLSACDTGVGKLEGSEGVYSMRRAFQEAGARAVLSTLWTASDDGTQALMARFYHYFLQGIPPQRALRKVQMEFLQHPTYRHPYYWANFVLTGADRHFPECTLKPNRVQTYSVPSNSVKVPKISQNSLCSLISTLSAAMVFAGCVLSLWGYLHYRGKNTKSARVELRNKRRKMRRM